jgi:hypothetical protein
MQLRTTVAAPALQPELPAGWVRGGRGQYMLNCSPPACRAFGPLHRWARTVRLVHVHRLMTAGSTGGAWLQMRCMRATADCPARFCPPTLQGIVHLRRCGRQRSGLAVPCGLGLAMPSTGHVIAHVMSLAMSVFSFQSSSRGQTLTALGHSSEAYVTGTLQSPATALLMCADQVGPLSCCAWAHVVLQEAWV